MHFSDIELYNYGIYKGLHSISLTDRQGQKNITLIGGMNGRGKTSLLDAVFLCLYGRKATEFIIGKREAYSSVLRNRINKSAADQSAHIKLTLHMEDDENTVISVTRSWQQNGPKISSVLRVERNGTEDNYLSDNWEYYVDELIPFGIARFFFFDNEKIGQFADDDAFDKIKDSIKSVIGVTTIEALCAHVEKIRKDKGIRLNQSETDALIKESEALSQTIEACGARIQHLQSQKAALIPELDKINDNIEHTEQAFWKNGGNLGINRDAIAREQRSLKESSDSLKEAALALAANPAAPLCLCKNLVISAYNKSMSEEETRAKHDALPIISHMYDSLLTDFKNSFSDSSDPYVKLQELLQLQLGALKKEAAGRQTAVLTPLAQTLMEQFVSKEARNIVAQTSRIMNENERVSAALQQLEMHLNSSADKNDTLQLLDEIKALQTQKTQTEAELSKCADRLRSAQYEKEQLERQRNKVLLKIAAEADTSDDNIRIIEYSTMTLEVMHEFTRRLQSQKVHQLEKKIMSCFEYLAQKQAVITSISIDPATLDITLKDYKGGILSKDQLSAGEKQLFAISILWGLALSSGYKLPVIIDTPMARLDSSHRSNFINRYLPNASSQVIVLSTDEEINGKYLKDIKEYVNAAYTLVYDEEEKCSSIQPGYFGGALQ